jgi:hypothetical protein
VFDGGNPRVLMLCAIEFGDPISIEGGSVGFRSTNVKLISRFHFDCLIPSPMAIEWTGYYIILSTS